MNQASREHMKETKAARFDSLAVKVRGQSRKAGNLYNRSRQEGAG
jgi:hypothetical protein